jgi:serine/threonine protein kinase
MDYGPWAITSVLHSKRGTDIFGTTDFRWVLKVVDNSQRSIDELRVVLAIVDKRPRHSIEFPPSMYGLYGRTPSAGWFALRRYSGHVDIDTYCRDRWRIIAVHVLQFLQDFHHDHGLAHMDIKKANILINHDKHDFVVADYEHAETPHTRLTSSYEDEYKWYYMSMGAELDEPLISWRFDLVALGYILASLTSPPQSWQFEKICWDKRRGRGPSTEEALALRAADLASVNPVVADYLEKVKAVEWFLPDPPSRAFYKSLESLFISV